jgi:hypothetical protein
VFLLCAGRRCQDRCCYSDSFQFPQLCNISLSSPSNHAVRRLECWTFTASCPAKLEVGGGDVICTALKVFKGGKVPQGLAGTAQLPVAGIYCSICTQNTITTKKTYYMLSQFSVGLHADYLSRTFSSSTYNNRILRYISFTVQHLTLWSAWVPPALLILLSQLRNPPNISFSVTIAGDYSGSSGKTDN